MKNHQDVITNARSNVNENAKIMNGSSDTELIDRNIGNYRNIVELQSQKLQYFSEISPICKYF